MHPTTYLLLADDKIAEYRREADNLRLASQAHRTSGETPIAARPRSTPAPASVRPVPATQADC